MPTTNSQKPTRILANKRFAFFNKLIILPFNYSAKIKNINGNIMNQKPASQISRRDFFKNCAYSASSVILLNQLTNDHLFSHETSMTNLKNESDFTIQSLDLSPAKWIWYPSRRTLQNSFFLFRKEITLSEVPIKATGWILADSRYLLLVNGKRIQWGPAPCDPRWVEADPLQLSQVLKPGKNIIGAQVLFYGQGDGTWPIGKPGFIFRLELELANGQKQQITSDSSWRVHLARSWQPGHYKRWYVRALQEEFDARIYPYGWTESNFMVNNDWLPAMELDCPADRPSLCANYSEYLFDISGDRKTTSLRPRSIPFMNEIMVPALKLAESMWIKWLRPITEYFEFVTPNAFEAIRTPAAAGIKPNIWEVQMDGTNAAALTFEFKEQIVGWPYFTIDAPEGTIIELMIQEAHEVGGPSLLNTHHHSWARFICKAGLNHFETFDFESPRWVQLHIHHAAGKVTISEVGIRRRIFPWPNPAQISCSDPTIQKLLSASINTLNNSAQETIVDGMGRERQQYSGDCGHQLHAIWDTYGELRQPARFLNTFSQGITSDGFFLDCWPAYDRLARLMERQLQLTQWGPLLDHSVGFNFDCYYHYLYTGDLTALKEVFPRLIRFLPYLQKIQQENGLLPVENIGIPAVWIDHNAYQKPRHKQCAFNLYAAAMAIHAFAPLCEAFGETVWKNKALEFGQQLLHATQKAFWSPELNVFINNLPWYAEERAPRMCDRSLATAILFDQCPQNQIKASLEVLANLPAEMGLSYPANANWRIWALAKGQRIDVVLKEFRTRWNAMQSVHLNNSLQEDWVAHPDSGSQWSHCAVVPLYVFYMNIIGLIPKTPGFQTYQLWPQLGDLEQIDAVAHTVCGPISFQSKGRVGKRQITIETPPETRGELILSDKEEIKLIPSGKSTIPETKVYELAGGRKFQLDLKFT